MGIMKLPQAIEAQIRDIPMISEVAQKLIALNADPNHSLRDVVQIVEKDVYVTARLLRIANSALYSRGNEITTVQRAVMHLGETMVSSVALNTSTGELLTKPLAGYDSAEGSLWAHCLVAAIAARKIALLTNDKRYSPDQAYTAAMLMDIGMVVLSDHLSPDVKSMVEKVDSREAEDFLDAEEDTTGTNHAEVGRALGSHWDLPAPLASAIEFHHHPGNAPDEYKPLVYAVHVADIVSRMAGYGIGVETFAYTMDEGFRNYVPLDPRRIEALMVDVLEEFGKIEQFILA